MTMKLYRLIPVLVALGGLIALIARAASTQNDFEPVSDQSLLPILTEGLHDAAAAVRSGAGPVTVVQRKTFGDGAVVEIRTDYTVAFRGARARYSAFSEIVADSRAPIQERSLVRRGVGSVAEKVVALAPNRIVRYEPGGRSAVVGDVSTALRRELTEYELNLAIPRHGVVDIREFSSPPAPFAQGEPRIVGRETIAGDECIVVEIVNSAEVSGSRVVDTWWFWVAPHKGFTVPRIRNWVEGGIAARKSLVAELDATLRDYGNGVWGPGVVTEQHYEINQSTGEARLFLRKTITYGRGFVLNSEVTDADLTLNLPSGTKVEDLLADVEYTVP